MIIGHTGLSDFDQTEILDYGDVTTVKITLYEIV
jgi:hypothetical protein